MTIYERVDLFTTPAIQSVNMSCWVMLELPCLNLNNQLNEREKQLKPFKNKRFIYELSYCIYWNHSAMSEQWYAGPCIFRGSVPTLYSSFISYNMGGHDKTSHNYISGRAVRELDAGPTQHYVSDLQNPGSMPSSSRPPRRTTYCKVIVSPRDSTLHVDWSFSFMLRKADPYTTSLPLESTFAFEGAVYVPPQRSKTSKKLFPFFLPPRGRCFLSSSKKQYLTAHFFLCSLPSCPPLLEKVTQMTRGGQCISQHPWHSEVRCSVTVSLSL